MWTCSKCGTEVEEGFDFCWSCVTSAPPEALVTLALCASVAEADLVRAALRDVGITASDADDSTDATEWFAAKAHAGIQLLVRARDMRQAREILATLSPTAAPFADEDPLEAAPMADIVDSSVNLTSAAAPPSVPMADLIDSSVNLTSLPSQEASLEAPPMADIVDSSTNLAPPAEEVPLAAVPLADPIDSSVNLGAAASEEVPLEAPPMADIVDSSVNLGAAVPEEVPLEAPPMADIVDSSVNLGAAAPEEVPVEAPPMADIVDSSVKLGAAASEDALLEAPPMADIIDSSAKLEPAAPQAEDETATTEVAEPPPEIAPPVEEEPIPVRTLISRLSALMDDRDTPECVDNPAYHPDVGAFIEKYADNPLFLKQARALQENRGTYFATMRARKT